MILVGLRSPLVVEYEETCDRLGLRILAALNVGGAPRVMDRGPVINLEEANSRTDLREHGFVACAFSIRRRLELIEIADTLGLGLAPALIDPSAIVARTVRVGRGSFVNSGAIIGAASMIGRNCLINRASSLGHHSILADNVTIGPGVTLASNIAIGKNATVGAGATIVPNVRIGDNAIVGAGSVIRKDVPDGTFHAGNPARQFDFNAADAALYAEGEE